MIVTPSFTPTIDTVLALNTRRGKVDVRGIESYAARLQSRADHAAWRGERHEAAHLRTLAYVHRAAALKARRDAPRRWWQCLSH